MTTKKRTAALLLVHPAFVVGVLAEFVGVDVAAVFVEVDLAVLLAHVDLELAGGAASLPTVVVVANAEVALAESEDEAATWGEFDVECAAEGSGELEEGVEGVGLFEQHGDGDEDVDRDHVLGLDAEDEPEEKLLVAEDHGDGDEEAEDAGPGSVATTSGRRPRRWVKEMAEAMSAPPMTDVR